MLCDAFIPCCIPGWPIDCCASGDGPPEECECADINEPECGDVDMSIGESVNVSTAEFGPEPPVAPR